MRLFRLNGCVEESEYSGKNPEQANMIMTRSDEFNQKNHDAGFCFVSLLKGKTFIAGLILLNDHPPRELLDSYLTALGIRVSKTRLSEITFENFRSILRGAYRNDYIEDDDVILEKYGLDCLQEHSFHVLDMEEEIISGTNKRDVYRSARSFLIAGSLIGELDRIYAGKQLACVGGHPVHYMIESDDAEITDKSVMLLLQALYGNQRLTNKRYAKIIVPPDLCIDSNHFDCWYSYNAGGAVIIRFRAGDESEDDHASASRYLTEKICEYVKKYCNKTLTIFCLPRECTKLRNLLYEYLINMSFVEIKEEFAYNDQARKGLRKLASAAGISADKTLLTKIEKDKGYLAPMLRVIFDEWFNKRLKTDVYPQYQDITMVNAAVIKAKPQGNAYDELAEMIGLTEARKVINQALNYYKAIKLFRERGLKDDKPAMHMVFTGNPGTAKTTVARLFARIMKDNGLLSKGELIEVGRSDLVGQYVGWTAPTVKQKFMEAKGSVLFIDEAYSLVDDRGGSYGDEAINTIVQEMENHRDDVVVIFAGYPKEMENFLRKNPGLRSRIAFHVPFEDYDTRELCDIAELVARKKGLKLSEDARERLVSVFDAARVSEDFGNGRYVRNVIEKAKMALTNRLVSMDIDSLKDEDIITIRGEDIEMPEEKQQQPVRRIGFSA